MLYQLAPKYMNTGKVQVVYRHFTFIGAESEWAANASECAAEQSKFWLFVDFLFKNQAGENVGAFSRANLKGFAARVGLDMNAFNACFDANKYASVVQQETDKGRQLGVRATPTFFINGRFLEGLLAADRFGALIDSMLPR